MLPLAPGLSCRHGQTSTVSVLLTWANSRLNRWCSTTHMCSRHVGIRATYKRRSLEKFHHMHLWTLDFALELCIYVLYCLLAMWVLWLIQAVCGPSRNSFLTGKRPDSTNTWTCVTDVSHEQPTVSLCIPSSKKYDHMIMGYYFLQQYIHQGIPLCNHSLTHSRTHTLTQSRNHALTNAHVHLCLHQQALSLTLHHHHHLPVKLRPTQHQKENSPSYSPRHSPPTSRGIPAHHDHPK